MKRMTCTMIAGAVGASLICGFATGSAYGDERMFDRVRRHYATPPAIRHLQREHGLTPENTPDPTDTMFDRIRRHYATPPHVRRQQREHGFDVPGAPGPDDRMLDRIRRYYAVPPEVRRYYRESGVGYSVVD
jgi:hypothetical protein